MADALADTFAALTEPASIELRPRLDALAQIELIENDALMPERSSAMLRAAEEGDVEERQDRLQPVPLDAPGLALAPKNVERGLEVRRAFENAGANSIVAEQLLEEFVAGEVAIVRELQDVEGALVGLLGRTVTDPALALKVAEVLRETVALSGAVRRRAEGSLAAVAGLRAQRVLMPTYHPLGVKKLGK